MAHIQSQERIPTSNGIHSTESAIQWSAVICQWLIVNSTNRDEHPPSFRSSFSIITVASSSSIFCERTPTPNGVHSGFVHWSMTASKGLSPVHQQESHRNEIQLWNQFKWWKGLFGLRSKIRAPFNQDEFPSPSPGVHSRERENVMQKLKLLPVKRIFPFKDSV